MMIRLRVFGALERYLGGAQFEIELPAGARLRDLYDLIHERWGRSLPADFWDANTKRFRGPVVTMVQRKDASDEEMVLAEGQEVWFVVVLGGG
jgi:molybdopterin converting factor small subunit